MTRIMQRVWAFLRRTTADHPDGTMHTWEKRGTPANTWYACTHPGCRANARPQDWPFS